MSTNGKVMNAFSVSILYICLTTKGLLATQVLMERLIHMHEILRTPTFTYNLILLKNFVRIMVK